MNESYMGKVVTVGIVSTGKHFLKGEPLSKEPKHPTMVESAKIGHVTGVEKGKQTFKQDVKDKDNKISPVLLKISFIVVVISLLYRWLFSPYQTILTTK